MTKGMDDPDSLTGWYLRILTSNRRQLLSVCKLIVADAYFSKESFVTGVQRLGFDLVSRGWTFRWVQPKRCCTTLQWWSDLFPCPENMRT
ncbi:MAG: hypothetical protein MJZ06_09470 [Bacteroidaceae bacterium]|nr:hypothetical protein [Bacteroidaceae bacterium]